MFDKSAFYFLCLCVVIGNTSIVDTLFKCRLEDGACHKKLLEKGLSILCKEGAPEFGIPILDPYEIKQMAFNIPNIMDLKLNNAEVEGIKDCIINTLSINYVKGYSFLDMTCPKITFKGQYKLDATAPILKSVFNGKAMKGDGKTKVKIDKMNLKMKTFFGYKERDGKIYTYGKGKVAELISFDIEKATFKMDNLYLGKEDASKLFTDFVNDNWKTLISTLGKPLIDKTLKIGIEYIGKFFNSVPVDQYIVEDMSHYVT